MIRFGLFVAKRSATLKAGFSTGDDLAQDDASQEKQPKDWSRHGQRDRLTSGQRRVMAQ